MKQPNCGYRRSSCRLTARRILPAMVVALSLAIGGPVFAIKRHPSVAEINYRTFGNKFPAAVMLIPRGGTGVVVSPTWVLTAAHCVDRDALGGAECSVKVDGKMLSVEEIVLHPRYELGFMHHDIALLRLSEPVQRESTLPVYVGDGEAGKNCVIVGYGWGSPFGTSVEPGSEPVGEESSIKRAGTNRVSRVTPETIHANNTLKNGRTELGCGIASGDSGGPLIIEFDGNRYVAGIVSGTTADDVDEADFTRVSAYGRWIEDVTGDDFGAPRPATPWLWGCVLTVGALYLIGLIFFRKRT